MLAQGVQLSKRSPARGSHSSPGPPAQQTQSRLGLTLKPRALPVSSSLSRWSRDRRTGRAPERVLREPDARKKSGPNPDKGSRSPGPQAGTPCVLSQPRAKPSRGICLSARKPRPGAGRSVSEGHLAFEWWSGVETRRDPPVGDVAPRRTLSLQNPWSLEVCPHVTRFLDDTNRMAYNYRNAVSPSPRGQRPAVSFTGLKSRCPGPGSLQRLQARVLLLPASSTFWGSWLVAASPQSLSRPHTAPPLRPSPILSLGLGPP